jgi:iron(III) transport system substrate-binding protein
MKQALAALAGLCLSVAALAEEPPSYGDLAQAAQREGVVRVYSTDVPQFGGVLDDFRAAYPGIQIDYVKHGSAEQYGMIVSEAAGGGMADLVLSSGVDLQIKLVNDGYAMSYASPEAAHLPAWLRWRDMAYGVTAEPVVIIYNKRLVPAEDVPKNHADLLKLLTGQPGRYKGKIATYDVERAATGLLFATQDVQITEKTWDLFRAMGQSGVKVYSAASAMLDRVAAGDQLIAYNVIGSYALDRVKSQPELGIVLPDDYTLLLHRIAFVPKAAPHPNAGKLFLNFLMSKRGQRSLASHFLGAVRDDMSTEETGLDRAAPFRAIKVGPELLTYLDQSKRARFLKSWRAALDGGQL